MKLLFGRGHLLRAARLEACASCCERACHLPVHLREVEVRLGEGAVHVKDHAAKHRPGRSGHAARARHSGEMRRATKDERGKGAEHAKLARPGEWGVLWTDPCMGELSMLGPPLPLPASLVLSRPCFYPGTARGRRLCVQTTSANRAPPRCCPLLVCLCAASPTTRRSICLHSLTFHVPRSPLQRCWLTASHARRPAPTATVT